MIKEPAREDETGDDLEITPDGKVSIPSEKRPCFIVFEKWTKVEEHDKKCKPGVWYFGFSKKGKNGDVELTLQLVCSPLYIDAITADEHNGNFGRVLRFKKNSRNVWRTWAMPMEMLAGSGEILRAELLAQGVTIAQDAKHTLLLKYISETKPTKHVRCTTRVGWSGELLCAAEPCHR